MRNLSKTEVLVNCIVIVVLIVICVSTYQSNSAINQNQKYIRTLREMQQGNIMHHKISYRLRQDTQQENEIYHQLSYRLHQEMFSEIRRIDKLIDTLHTPRPTIKSRVQKPALAKESNLL